WSAPATVGLSVARPSAARNGSRPVLPRILLSLFCCASATAFIHPPFSVFTGAGRPACALRRDIVFPDRMPGSSHGLRGTREPICCVLAGIGHSSSALAPKRISYLLWSVSAFAFSVTTVRRRRG